MSNFIRVLQNDLENANSDISLNIRDIICIEIFGSGVNQEDKRNIICIGLIKDYFNIKYFNNEDFEIKRESLLDKNKFIIIGDNLYISIDHISSFDYNGNVFMSNGTPFKVNKERLDNFLNEMKRQNNFYSL